MAKSHTSGRTTSQGADHASFHVAECPSCRGRTVHEDPPAASFDCVDCGHEVGADDARRYLVPSGFRTSFRVEDGDEDPEITPTRRVVAAEIRNVSVRSVGGTNMSIHAGAGASILRLNDGPPSKEEGEPEGFSVRMAHQKSVWLPRGSTGRGPRLENQYVTADVTHGKNWWEEVEGGEQVGIRLLSRKPTEALYLRLGSVPPGLRLAHLSRATQNAPIRAAAVSATQMILQRAALELDIDPDEFEALEPRLTGGLPMIQIADNLINGAGFCRRLAEPEGDGRPTIVRLIGSMLDDESDPIVSSFRTELHRRECAQACYRCLQRYGNRQYHGLLDWRLGLGFLRALMKPSYASGLDGRWTDVELLDWQTLATSVRDELCRLNEKGRTPVTLGSMALPGIREISDLGTRFYLIVHPFWRVDDAVMSREPFRSARRDAGSSAFFFVDMFDASRRPVSALEVSRNREA